MTIFKFYSLAKFQLYSTILSTIVIMLYIRSSGLNRIITELFYIILPTSPHFPHPTAHGNHLYTFCFSEFDFFFSRFYIQVIACSICLSLSSLFNLGIMPSSFTCVVANGRISFLPMAEQCPIVYTPTPHLLFPFIC